MCRFTRESISLLFYGKNYEKSILRLDGYFQSPGQNLLSFSISNSETFLFNHSVKNLKKLTLIFLSCYFGAVELKTEMNITLMCPICRIFPVAQNATTLPWRSKTPPFFGYPSIQLASLCVNLRQFMSTCVNASFCVVEPRF